MTRKPTITMHVVSSIDGFIAKPDNTVTWLESPNDAYPAGVSEPENAEEALKAIDCWVLGSRTYEHAMQLGWVYGDTPTIVVTKRTLPAARATVEFYAGGVDTLVKDVLAPRFERVWVVGGAALCQTFLRHDLIDEIRLIIAPVLLGQGLHLFGATGVERRWRLKNVVTYKTAFVELAYQREE